MKSALVINLAIGVFLLLWTAVSDTFTIALASDIANELRFGASDIQPIEFADLVDLLRRATKTDLAVCAVAGGAIVVTSSLGLWSNSRRAASPDPGRESGG